ncbi:MAG: MBG domain-containing protein, partial [Clostridia bacterium]
MNTKKRYISILMFTLFLAVITVFAVLPTAAFAAGGEEVIYISTANDFSTKISGITAGKTYVLKNDIYFSDRGFNSTIPFAGTFDGRGHSLISAKTTASLFSTITETGVVKNVNIINSQLTANNTGFITAFNNGLIDNVKVSGRVVGNNVGGLTGYNYGIIENSFVKVVFESEKAGAFTNINVKAHQEDGEIIIDKNGIIRESYFDCYLYGDKLLSPVGDDNEGLYPGEYNEPLDSLIADGYIDDLFDIWYFKALETPPTVTQRQDINLYNIAGLEIAEAVQLSIYQLNGKVFYNNKSDYQAVTPYAENAEPAPLAAETLEGSGTEQNPYIISQPSHLAYIAEMENSEGIHFYLANSISLYDHGSEVYYNVHIANFAGVFDGAGRAISGILGGELFGVNTGEIKNLFVRGYAYSGSALLVGENQGLQDTNGELIGGLISNVEVFAEFSITEESNYAAAVAHTNTGRISGVTINTHGTADYAVGVTVSNTGEISRTRNFSELPFLFYNSSNIVRNVYNAHPVWSVTDAEWIPYYSVLKYGSEYIARTDSPADIYSFIRTSGENWGFQKGILADIPVLKFATDNIAYKELTLPASEVLRSYRESGYNLRIVEGYYYDYNGLPTGGTGDYGLWHWEKENPETSEYVPIGELGEPDIVIKNVEGNDTPFALNAGAFRVYYEVSSTESKAGYAGYAYFTIEKAIKEYSESDFEHIIGILLDDAGEGVPYAGNNIIIDQLIVPKNGIQGTIYDYQFTNYSPHSAYSGGELPLNDLERKGYFENGNAGTYTIVMTATHPNYEFLFNLDWDFRFKISPLTLTVNPIMTANPDIDAEIPYNTNLQNYILQNVNLDIQGLVDRDVTSDELINIANYSFATNYTQGVSGVGQGYYIKVENRPLINYVLDLSGNNGRANFKVVKAAIPNIDEVGFEGKTVTYSGEYHTIAATNLKEHMQMSYIQGERYIDANENQIVTINISYKDNADNYISVQKSASITITPKPITVTANNIEVAYKSAPPIYTASVPVVERADDEQDFVDIILSCSYQQGDPVGGYMIARSGGIGNPNYTIVFESGTLTVVRAARTLSLLHSAPVYNRLTYSPQFFGDTEELATSGYTVSYQDALGNPIG